jgi:ring-1,2-phenylacetyl-CoA epoxidase subunit PaaA
MDMPDESGKRLASVANAPSDQEAAFEARIDADGRIEPQD